MKNFVVEIVVIRRELSWCLEQKINLNHIKRFFGAAMHFENTKILDINQYQKSIIYADLEYLIKKIDGCKNHP